MPEAGVGEMGNRLSYKHLYTCTGLFSADLDLQTFLQLRACVHERFPATIQLSDVQLLLLLTLTTVPWPVHRDHLGFYEDFQNLFLQMSIKCKHIERMPGHPAATGAHPPPSLIGMGVPTAMAAPSAYETEKKCVDGLRTQITLDTEFRSDLEAKLALVTEFHLGQRR